MKPPVVYANPRLYKYVGLAALMRGPVVYCLEEADNGRDLHLVRMGRDPQLQEAWSEELGGIVALTSRGERIDRESWEGQGLYAPAHAEKCDPATLRWIPYYAWSNRGEGEMRVWIHR